MATTKKKGESTRPPMPPARTPQGRENQLIALAEDLAEKQLRDGTATSQLMTHYLKLATAREQLEREKLRGENELLKAKVAQLSSMENSENLQREALNAFRAYSGQEPGQDDD